MKYKNLLLIACERSGVHFTINSIANNIIGYDNSFEQNKGNNWLDVPPTSNIEEIKNFLFSIEEDKGYIIKSHHQFDFFKSFWEDLIKRFKIIYLVRDGRDVMTSSHYYFNKAPQTAFPYTKTVGELCRRNPQKYSHDVVYSMDRSNTYVERWIKHVNKWLSVCNNIGIIKYEDLYLNFYHTLIYIGFILNSNLVDPVKRPLINNSKSISPRKGIIGDWINHFNRHELEFFYNEVYKINQSFYNYIYYSKDKIKAEYIGE